MPTLAECPQIFVETVEDKTMVRFLELPDTADIRYYLVPAGGNKERQHPATPQEDGYILPPDTVQVFFVTARQDIDKLSSYRIDADDSKGATFIHHPLPRELQTDHLDGLHSSAEVCSLVL